MKKSLVHRSLRLGVSVGAAAGLLLSAAPAHAAPPTTIVAAGGSDTTLLVMNKILSTSNSATSGQYNIPSVPAAGGFAVPNDAECNGGTGNTTWYAPPLPTLDATHRAAPNGSGAGKNELLAEAEPGGVTAPIACMDIARSSSPPSASDGKKFEYYAFAASVLGWGSPSLNAPPTLSLDQFRGIYNCTFNDWSQVGGVAGPIQRYIPQVGSGTSQTFKQYLLGLANKNTPVTDTTAFPLTGPNGACPQPKDTQTANSNLPFEENQGTQIDPADYQTAILPYDNGNWSYQSQHPTNPTIDIRNGVRLGAFTQAAVGANPGTPAPTYGVQWSTLDGVFKLNTTIVNEVNAVGIGHDAANTFPGVRLLWNVLDNVSPTNGYTTAKTLVGFDYTSAAGAKSPLCSGGKSSILTTYGYAPLSTTVDAVHNISGSTCRYYATGNP